MKLVNSSSEELFILEVLNLEALFEVVADVVEDSEGEIMLGDVRAELTHHAQTIRDVFSTYSAAEEVVREWEWRATHVYNSICDPPSEDTQNIGDEIVRGWDEKYGNLDQTPWDLDGEMEKYVDPKKISQAVILSLINNRHEIFTSIASKADRSYFKKIDETIVKSICNHYLVLSEENIKELQTISDLQVGYYLIQVEKIISMVPSHFVSSDVKRECFELHKNLVARLGLTSRYKNLIASEWKEREEVKNFLLTLLPRDLIDIIISYDSASEDVMINRLIRNWSNF